MSDSRDDSRIAESLLSLYSSWLDALRFYADGGNDGGRRAYAAIAPPQPKIDRLWPLNVDPNDVIVFEADGDLSEDEAQALTRNVEFFFPDHKVMFVQRVRIGTESP